MMGFFGTGDKQNKREGSKRKQKDSEQSHAAVSESDKAGASGEKSKKFTVSSSVDAADHS